MPEWITWLVRLALLGAVILLTVEVRRLRRQVSGRDDREAARARHAEETEQQVLDLLGHRRERRPDPHDQGQKHRRLWLLPPAAVGVLMGAVGWVKHWSGPIAGAVAGAAAVTLFFITSSASSPHAMHEPPAPVPPYTTTTTVRWPSSTSELPPLTTTAAPTTSTTTPSTPALTEDMTPQAAPPLPTVTTTVTEDGHGKHGASISKTKVTGSKTTSCLLRLDLLLGVCVD